VRIVSKKGLLQRAIEVQEVPPVSEGEDQYSGIDAEDRREITAQIDEISRKNRISITPERLAITPLKKGFLFPLLVNLIAIGCTAGALWGLSVLFSQKEAQYSSSAGTLNSAEGKLIQELKKDAESRISEKDKQISDFQSRLAAMEQEQTKLQASFEQRLATKESELKAQLQKELEQEKARLIALGLSDLVIQERLKKFEQEKMAAIQKEIDSYKTALAAERAASEANYDKLRKEYQNSIASLNDERKKIQEESQRREEQLRSSMEAKTQELAAQAQQASAGLAQAKAELAKMEEQRKNTAAAEDRIVGLYLAVRSALQENRYNDAVTNAAALRSYLLDPSLASLTGLQNRRPADLFAADVFSQLARTQLEQAKTDNTLLLSQAELVAAVRDLTAQAQTALKAGQNERAADLYNQALAKIPEILSAHNYFIDQRDQQTAQKQAQALRALDRGKAAFTAKDYGASAAAYTEAALLLGLSDNDAKALVDGIANLGYQRGNGEKRSSDTRAAQGLMTRAKREMDNKRWKEATALYTQILSSYPDADQTNDAATGINQALTLLSQDSQNQIQERDAKIQDLNAKIEQLSADLQNASNQKTLATSRITDLEQKNAQLEKLLEEARQNTMAAAKNTDAGNTEKPANGTDERVATLTQDLAKLREENARLSGAAKKYDTLLVSYAQYQQAENSALAKSGASALVEARSQLDSFLTAPETRQAFPDLRERIARYERDFVAAGQKESIYNAMTIADNALRLKDQTSRTQYFQDLTNRYRDDKDMIAFIETLRRGLR